MPAKQVWSNTELERPRLVGREIVHGKIHFTLLQIDNFLELFSNDNWKLWSLSINDYETTGNRVRP